MKVETMSDKHALWLYTTEPKKLMWASTGIPCNGLYRGKTFLEKWHTGAIILAADEPPKPDKAPDGKEFTGECRIPVHGEPWLGSCGNMSKFDFLITSGTSNSRFFGGRRWILRKSAVLDREDVLAALSKIKDSVETAIKELT